MLKKNFYDLALLLLRVGFGGFMLTHGIPKIAKLSDPSTFPDPLGIGHLPSLILALIGEVVAPILIIIGFKTKLSAIPAAITMFVAAFVMHAKDSLASKEHALLYFIVFVVLFLTGAGKISVDRM